MKSLFPLLLCVLWPVLALATPLCRSPVMVGFDNWPPYHYYLRSEAANMQGFAVETLDAVLARMGCQAKYVERPWKRVLQDIEQGELDMAMEAFFNADRARYAHFSDSYNPGRTMLWVRAGSRYPQPALASWLAAGHQLGVTKGYFYGDEVMALLARYSGQVSAVNDQQNYGKLVRGRIDGFLGDMLATPWALRQEGLYDQVVAHGKPVHELPTFFLFSKRRIPIEFVRRFNRELAGFKATSEYEIIWRRYAFGS